MKGMFSLRKMLAIVSLACIVITSIVFVKGETLVPNSILRIWILGLGGLCSILGTYLYLAMRYTDRDQVENSLLFLTILSLATTIVWSLITLVVLMALGILHLSSHPSAHTDEITSILSGTILLPLQISHMLVSIIFPSELFPSYTNVLFGVIFTFVTTAGTLFGLGIIAGGLYHKKSV